MRKPNFFLVGAPKCGTSSMDSYLGQHPQVFMARKEPHYFASDLDWAPAFGGIKDHQQYLRIFRAARNEPIVGEASVYYLYSLTAAANIRAFAPESKILCMLRDPVDAVRSFFHMNVANGSEDILDLSEALAAEPDRIAGRRVAPRVHVACDVYYTRVADFAPQVERFLEVFGRPAVHFVLFDDFLTDTLGTYRELLRFLGVDDTFEPDLRVVNAARPIRNVGARQFFRQRRGIAGLLHRHVPPAWRRRAGDLAERLTKQKAVHAELDDALRRQLRARFEPGIRQLEGLIGRDLNAWLNPNQPPTAAPNA